MDGGVCVSYYCVCECVCVCVYVVCVLGNYTDDNESRN